MKRFNEWLALKITQGVATMWCAYLFALLAVVGFPLGSSNPKDYVFWLSAEFIQLVMLSIIMVGQNLLSQQHHERHQELLKHVKKGHDESA